MVYVIDLYSKIMSNILRFLPIALLLSVALTQLYGKRFRRKEKLPFFLFCLYLVLLTGETLWGRRGVVVDTQEFIGIRQLFEDPWYLASAVENVVMFIPFGFLVVKVVPRINTWQRCLAVAVAVSGSIEFLQYIQHIGEAQLIDIVANAMGAMMGWRLERLAPR